MHRTLLGILLVLCAWAPAAAQTPEQLFQEGNALYQQGKLQDALQRYRTILDRGYVSGELCYNIGNVYYRTGRIAEAILFYERARRRMPQDEDLRHNLQMANLLITDRIEPTPRLFIWDFWDDIKNTFSAAGIIWTSYLAYLLALASVASFFLVRTFRLRRLTLLSTLLWTVLLVLGIVIAVAKISDMTRTDEAIIMEQVVTVKNSPDERASDAFVLHSGTKVRMTDQVADWVEIHLADGKVGWVARTALETI